MSARRSPNEPREAGAPGGSGVVRPPRRRGRRAGGEDTRAALVAAARDEFAERGFDGATVRRIAERAGVDPAMVNHWFGGKEALFTAAIEVPVDAATVVTDVLPGDPDELGERIVRTFLQVWDAAGGGTMAALVRSVAGHPAATRMMREFVSRVILGPVAARICPDEPELRTALCASQILGLGMMRYVVQLEPVASADHAALAAAIGPTLQRYLTGPLPAATGG